MAIQSPLPTTTTPALTSNDSRILTALFDPETLPSSFSATSTSSLIDASLPPLPNFTADEFSALESAERAALRTLAGAEGKGEEVEKEVVERAILDLDWIIERSPGYASAWVNRGMARRLRCERLDTKGSGGGLFAEKNKEELEHVLEDLATAINHATPKQSGGKVSPFQARVLRTAFSHRAYLYLKAAQVLGEAADTDVKMGGVMEMEGKSREQLEEMASRDFEQAARYGDKVAKEMSVRTNPYAKMCGAIVRGALREERREFEEGRT